MKYSEIRNNLKSGDVVALSHQQWNSLSDIESQIVKSVTQSEFSHVAIILVMDGTPFLVESVVPFVRIMPLDNLEEDFYLIQTGVPISDTEKNFMFSQVATGAYSKLEAIAAQLELLDIGSNSNWSCAEFLICARKLSHLSISTKATPAAVVKFLLDDKGFSLQYVKKV
jgi:hypothetical protein